MYKIPLFAALLMLTACNSCKQAGRPIYIAPPVTLICEPCLDQDGQLPIRIETVMPVPVADILAHNLCFEAEIGSHRCWYNCPGHLEDNVARGPELCTTEPPVP